MRRRRSTLFAAAVLLAACAGVDLPRDPESTLSRAEERGRLRVGVAESPPWVVRRGGEAAGLEADLVRGFAAGRGLEVEWVWGGAGEHLAALEKFELDAVAAGLTADSPWSKRVAFTRRYVETRRPGERKPARHVLAVPPGENRLLVALESYLGGEEEAVRARLATDPAPPEPAPREGKR
jgi:polar amino acid transport system substrate-binding protein